MPNKNWFGIITCTVLAGCSNGWISNPSPSTRSLVSDLRLEGFNCEARFSYIECLQIEPSRNKQAALCDSKNDSKNGCIEQPDVLIYNRYQIQQQDNGLPSLKHDLVKETEGKVIGGTKVVPG